MSVTKQQYQKIETDNNFNGKSGSWIAFRRSFYTWERIGKGKREGIELK